jgi:chorismate synthase
MLAHAMLSIPATKGFEIGSGFAGTKLRGSQHNDAFVPTSGNNSSSSSSSSSNNNSNNNNPSEPHLLKTLTNNAGGTLGGITSGQDIVFRVAIKPVSTIGRAQKTATFDGKAVTLEAKGRHDPFVLPRAVPIVEAMAALVLADLALIQLARAGSMLVPTGGGGTAIGTKDEVSGTVNLVNSKKRKR